jgi:head-tail adaptor
MSGIRAEELGEFNRRIIIQQPIKAIDTKTHEHVTDGWQDVATIWAKRMWKSSTEKEESNQQVGNEIYDYKILWQKFEINSTMRIKDKSENAFYYVTGVNKADWKVSIMLTVVKRDNEE